MSKQGYDIIGDIHGHADALRRLLTKLGYLELQGIFRHETRQVIFVGDFVDRGPEQPEVLRVARSMCDAETALAILGNHEFNAIGWATSDGKNGYLRSHSEAHTKQHEEFLRQIGDGSPDYKNAIRWFQTLPVWLEFPGLRVVHACWHEPSRLALKRSCLDSENRFKEEEFRKAFVPYSTEYDAAEILLKGPEQQLPSGMSFSDEDENERHAVRYRWWDNDATTLKQAAIGIKKVTREKLPNVEVSTDFRYRDSTPVLFGHYWLKGKPTITNTSAACLDFGVAANGYLTAYRWSGERELSSSHLVYVSAKG